jgi:hypothetical protein
MEFSSHSGSATRATHNIADGILMNTFVEGEIIRKRVFAQRQRNVGQLH